MARAQGLLIMARRSGRGEGRAKQANESVKEERAGRPSRDPIEELRRRIDAIDRRMVDLLNERAGCAIDLGRIKKERGLPIYQPAREEEVLGNVQTSNGGPLQSEALRRLFERIIDESRRIERGATVGDGSPAARGSAADPIPPDDAED